MGRRGFSQEMLMMKKWWWTSLGRVGSFTAAHWMVGSDVNGCHGDASGRRWRVAGVKEENVRGRGGWGDENKHYSG